jgi:hypothetical protein
MKNAETCANNFWGIRGGKRKKRVKKRVKNNERSRELGEAKGIKSAGFPFSRRLPKEVG